MQIIFAHRTFPWQSEARGRAHVHVVIIGFAQTFQGTKRIYEEVGDKVTVNEVRSISPYLVEGGNTVLLNREAPLCHVCEIGMGNQMIDGGNYPGTF